MKITNWRHNEGGSYLEQAVRSHWHCTFTDALIAGWVNDQGFVEDIDYDLNFRFNSGDPRYFLAIYNEKLATAFALRWT